MLFRSLGSELRLVDTDDVPKDCSQLEAVPPRQLRMAPAGFGAGFYPPIPAPDLPPRPHDPPPYPPPGLERHQTRDPPGLRDPMGTRQDLAASGVGEQARPRRCSICSGSGRLVAPELRELEEEPGLGGEDGCSHDARLR